MDKFKLLEWYHSQGRSAAKRKIDFLLTFDEWLKIWVDSKHLHERGAKRGCYVMSRKNDTGPYSVTNVEIVLHEKNCGDVWKNKGEEYREKQHLARLGHRAHNKGVPHSEETKAKMSKAQLGHKRLSSERARQLGLMQIGKKHSAEHIAKCVAARLGSKRSEATKLKMSIARRAYWERKRLMDDHRH